eukprot:3031382-Rhodomonas_salina.1
MLLRARYAMPGSDLGMWLYQDFPLPACSGRTELCHALLNDQWVSGRCCATHRTVLKRRVAVCCAVLCGTELVPICLSVCYAVLSGTEVLYGIISLGLLCGECTERVGGLQLHTLPQEPGELSAYARATPCPVLTQGVCCYQYEESLFKCEDDRYKCLPPYAPATECPVQA